MDKITSVILNSEGPFGTERKVGTIRVRLKNNTYWISIEGSKTEQRFNHIIYPNLASVL
jgi:hypothetical protein